MLPSKSSKQYNANTDVDKIHELQEQVSKWQTKLAGVKVESDSQEIIDHITGIGHFAVLNIAALQKYDSKSEAAEFERAVYRLNSDLVSLHSTYQSRVSRGKDVLEQMKEVKAYAAAVYKAMKTFKKKWLIKTFPDFVQTKYKLVKAMAGDKSSD